MVDKYAGMIGSSSSTVCSNPYKPGGTLTVYDGNWSGRITRGVDPHKLGRWSFITILGRNLRKLTIITGYRVYRGQSNSNVGMSTTYMQQETIIRKNGCRTPPQEMFIVDLQSFIEGKISEGHEILLNLDTNEEWDMDGSRIHEMAMEVNLYDIAKEINPNGVPATYTRANSSTRIDFMLG